MNTQQQWLLNTLLEFYQNSDYLETLKLIINREYTVKNHKKLSIRMVNWFVTNYAKQYFTVYDVPSNIDGENGRRFFRMDQLQIHRRQLFETIVRSLL